LVVEEVGRQILDQAIAADKGVIVSAPHTGAWELIGLRLTCEQPMHFLYRVEKCINIAPAQYMWNYRRFRKTPENSEYRY